MAGFLESFDISTKPLSLPFTEMDPSFYLMSQLAELNSSLADYSNQTFLTSNTPEFLSSSTNDLPCLSTTECPKMSTISQATSSNKMQNDGSRKRKSLEVPNFSSETGFTESSAVGKRGKRRSKEVEKAKEVVHVRARRGQATDNHSLAERVRREKINERMRCLQGLIPGCYKAMGMAGMLDETINYVQSLQNQVEFLSMKLSAASSYQGFNSDLETIFAPLTRNTNEVREMESVLRGGYGECSSFHSILPY